jgi:type VI secretion system protein ImpC
MNDYEDRLRLTYTAEDGEVAREIELPFVIGVLADLSGAASVPRALLDERPFEDVCADTLESLLQSRRPRVRFDVPDVLLGTGALSIDLTFTCLDDFTPASVARRVEAVGRGVDSGGELALKLATQLDLIVCHEHFRALEASWRGLAYLLRHTGRHPSVKVLVLDVTKSELHESLRFGQSSSGPLAQKLVDDAYGVSGGEPFGCLIGDYTFDQSESDCLLLGAMATIGAAIECPFVGAASPALFHLRSWDEMAGRRVVADLLELPEYTCWRSLRNSVNSRYLVLGVPRICDGPRPPGDVPESEPAMKVSTRSLNAAFVIGAAVAEAFGIRGSWGGLTESLRNVTRDMHPEVEPEPASARALAGCGLLAVPGVTADAVEAALPTVARVNPPVSQSAERGRGVAFHHVLLCSRFAHYVHAIIRDIDFLEAEDCERWLRNWLTQYVDGSPQTSSAATKILHPLTSADVSVKLEGIPPARFSATLRLELEDSPQRPDRAWWRRRVEIEYEVEREGQSERVRLPFVIGVLADLTGTLGQPRRPPGDREFVDVDADTFASWMKSLEPGVAFQVPNTITGQGALPVELRFTTMDDFSPGGVARALGATNALLQERQHLAALLLYLEGKSEAHHALRRLAADQRRLERLAAADFAANLETEADTIDAFQLVTLAGREAVARGLCCFARGALKTSALGAQQPAALIEELIRGLEESLGRQLNLVLHHPDFQQLERTWLGLHGLVRTAANGDGVRIRAFNISKRSLHSNLKRARGGPPSADVPPPDVADMLRSGEENQPVGCLIGDYHVDGGQEDLELLEGMSEIAARLHCPFVVGAAPSLLQMTGWIELPHSPRIPERVATSDLPWCAFKERDVSRYLFLALPRYLGRPPYDQRADVAGFRFVEAVRDHEEYSWLNAAYALGTLVVRSFGLDHWPGRVGGLGRGGTLDGLPSCRTAPPGRFANVACPTEILISDARARELAEYGLVPLVSRKNGTSATFFQVNAFHQQPSSGGSPASEDGGRGTELGFLLAASRFAHAITAMCHDNRNEAWLQDCEDLRMHLQEWVLGYVNADSTYASEYASRERPLASASIHVEPGTNPRGARSVTLEVLPYYRFDGFWKPLSMVVSISDPPARAR